jgi:hypothetical protein
MSEQPMTVGADADSGAAPDISAAAGAALGYAGGQLAGAQQAVASGSVHLDPEVAATLLAALDQLTNQAGDLVTFSDQGVDQPLHFGHNWVGAIMDQRLHGAANGTPGSLRPVLSHFQAMLGEVADTVRQAAGLTTSTDEDSADQLNRTSR